MGGNSQLAAALQFVRSFAGSQQQDDGLRGSFVAVQRLDKIEAVTLRHVDVAQNQLKGLIGLLDRRLSFVRAGYGCDAQTPVGQHFFKDCAIGAVVLNKRPGSLNNARCHRHGSLIRNLHSRCKVKHTADARFAFDPGAAVHQPDKPGADGQAQARPAKTPRCRCVGLFKGIEDCLQFVRGDAYPGIRNSKVKLDGIVRLMIRFHVQHDLALLGELDRVTDHVHYDLPQLRRVADQRIRHIGFDVAGQFQVFTMRPHGQRLERVAQSVPQAEDD